MCSAEAIKGPAADSAWKLQQQTERAAKMATGWEVGGVGNADGVRDGRCGVRDVEVGSGSLSYTVIGIEEGPASDQCPL